MRNLIPHLVIRIAKPDKHGPFGGGDLIEEHNEVVARQGRVLFGKVGKRLADSKLRLIQEAIAAGNRATLVVVRGGGSQVECFQALIRGIWDASYTPDTQLCPTVVQDRIREMSLWLEIEKLEKVSDAQLTNYTLASTGRAITELLRNSQSSLMLVQESVRR